MYHVPSTADYYYYYYYYYFTCAHNDGKGELFLACANIILRQIYTHTQTQCVLCYLEP